MVKGKVLFNKSTFIGWCAIFMALISLYIWVDTKGSLLAFLGLALMILGISSVGLNRNK